MSLNTQNLVRVILGGIWGWLLHLMFSLVGTMPTIHGAYTLGDVIETLFTLALLAVLLLITITGVIDID